MKQNMTHGDILEAERIGSPVPDEVRILCDLCEETKPKDETKLRRVCEDCEDRLAHTAGVQDRLEVAARKAANSGSHKDLHAYLKLRRELY